MFLISFLTIFFFFALLMISKRVRTKNVLNIVFLMEYEIWNI